MALASNYILRMTNLVCSLVATICDAVAVKQDAPRSVCGGFQLRLRTGCYFSRLFVAASS